MDDPVSLLAQLKRNSTTSGDKRDSLKMSPFFHFLHVSFPHHVHHARSLVFNDVSKGKKLIPGSTSH